MAFFDPLGGQKKPKDDCFSAWRWLSGGLDPLFLRHARQCFDLIQFQSQALRHPGAIVRVGLAVRLFWSSLTGEPKFVVNVFAFFAISGLFAFLFLRIGVWFGAIAAAAAKPKLQNFAYLLIIIIHNDCSINLSKLIVKIVFPANATRATAYMIFLIEYFVLWARKPCLTAGKHRSMVF